MPAPNKGRPSLFHTDLRPQLDFSLLILVLLCSDTCYRHIDRVLEIFKYWEEAAANPVQSILFRDRHLEVRIDGCLDQTTGSIIRTMVFNILKSYLNY